MLHAEGRISDDAEEPMIKFQLQEVNPSKLNASSNQALRGDYAKFTEAVQRLASRIRGCEPMGRRKPMVPQQVPHQPQPIFKKHAPTAPRASCPG